MSQESPVNTDAIISADKIALLRDRAEMLATARMFLMERNVCEVDCPILSKYASIDAHIDLIPARYHGRENCYMHSSPEYGMKRLLASGMGDIFQLSHVFRDGESGSRHNPEFMMIEWYRLGMAFEEMMQETLEFIRLFLEPLPHRVISYREAVKKYAGIDYLHVSRDELAQYMMAKGIAARDTLDDEDKDSLLNIILGTLVEPQLGQNELTVLTFYPSTQAALAQTRNNQDELVSERFEIYYKGMELCNGYHELADPVEQRQRLIEENQQRLDLGKEALPIDENFLSALEEGLPDCCGVAVGFDRLMMLKHKRNTISDVIPFSWHNA